MKRANVGGLIYVIAAKICWWLVGCTLWRTLLHLACHNCIAFAKIVGDQWHEAVNKCLAGEVLLETYVYPQYPNDASARELSKFCYTKPVKGSQVDSDLDNYKRFVQIRIIHWNDDIRNSVCRNSAGTTAADTQAWRDVTTDQYSKGKAGQSCVGLAAYVTLWRSLPCMIRPQA